MISMNSAVRLIISAVISFGFYFAWSYWANGMATDDQALVFRSALVQGTLSATITILFTFILDTAWKENRKLIPSEHLC